MNEFSVANYVRIRSVIDYLYRFADSAAGLLMNSLGSKAALSPSQATQLKAALNLSEPTTLEQQQQLQQQQSKGATLPRERANPPTVDYSSQAKSALHSASAASLFR